MAGLDWNDSTTNTLFQFLLTAREFFQEGWELLDRVHFWILDDVFYTSRSLFFWLDYEGCIVW